MKKIALIISLFLPFILMAVDSIIIRSPGVKGMISNIDVQEMPQDGSYYSKNNDVFTTPGLNQRRRGIRPFGTNADTVYGAVGYLEQISGRKMAVAISNTDSIILYTQRTRTFTVAGGTDTTFTFSNTKDSLIVGADDIGITVSTDTSGTALRPFDSTFTATLDFSRRIFVPVTPNQFQDFLEFNNSIIHATASSPPYAFTTRVSNAPAAFAAGESMTAGYSPESIGYRQRTIGFEAPGQLRPTPLYYDPDNISALTGIYQWAYAFGDDGKVANVNAIGNLGIPSVAIKVSNQYVLLTGFLHRPYSLADSITDEEAGWGVGTAGGINPTYIVLARRQVDGANTWIRVDSFWVKPDEDVMFIDSGQGTVAINIPPDSASFPVPGTINSYSTGAHADVGFTTQTSLAFDDSTYWVRYSWYDPVLDIESALGPAKQLNLTDSSTSLSAYVMAYANIGLADTSDNVTTTPRFDSRSGPTDWIRLYRNIVQDNLLGGTDTLIWYCAGQYRTDRGMAAVRSTPTRAGGIWLGLYHDTMLANGVDPPDSIFNIVNYGDDNIASDADGAIVRPPFKFGIQVQFSDIEYANGRLWGVGDELFPQRLYYSKFDDMSDWSPNDFLSLSEDDNDELVAIESVPSEGATELLYAFKHNSVFAITGFDAEYDLQFTTITRRTGALDRFSVIKYQDEIFWLAPDMKIYSSSNFQPISDPVENYVDSLFGNYTRAQDSVRAYVLTDKVCWVNILTKKALAFHTKTRTWSLESYGSYVPYGSFQYDTLVNSRGFGENSWLTFRSDSAQSFMIEYTGKVDTIAGDSTTLFPWNYQTPFIGDGIAMWQIPYIEFSATADSATYVVATVFNEDGDSLVVDSVLTSPAYETTYRLGLPRHKGEYLSVKFRDNGGIKLSSVSLGRKRVGRARIK